MTKPTTIRLPEDLLKQLDRRVRDRNQDRASLIRELLSEGLARDLEEGMLAQHRKGPLSLSQAAERLGVDPWAFFDVLRRRGEPLNVELEDWIGSRRAL